MLPFYENRHSAPRVFISNSITYPSHLHSHLEMIYIIHGELEVSVSHHRQKLHTGDFTLVFPNTVHGYETTEGRENSVILVICEPSMAGSWMNQLMKYHPENPFLSGTSLHRDINYSITSLYQESKEASDMEILKAYIQLILARAIPRMKLVKNEHSLSTDSIYNVIRYVSENYSQPVNLEQMALELGISKYHLSRIFSSKLNTSFSDYTNSFRVNLAKNLLETSNNDIMQIAERCGFESQRTFNRVFKNYCGYSPREYRSINAK